MEYLCIYRAKSAFADHNIYIDNEKAIKFQHEYTKAKKSIKLNEYMEKSLNLLKENNYQIGIISNGLHDNQFEKLKYLDIYRYVQKNCIFISEDVGFHKPDSRIFDYVKKSMLKTSADKYNEMYSKDNSNEFFYIGDSYQNDIIGANNAGYSTIWVNHRSYKPTDRVSTASYTINSFDEIYNLIKSLIKK